VAYDVDTATRDVWVLDLTRGVRTRLTFGPVVNAFPAWSPDGRWIYYGSQRGGNNALYRKASDGSGEEELLLTDAMWDLPDSVTPDGKFLIYARGDHAGGDWDVMALPVEGDRKPRMLVQHAADGQISPDGKWLAYQSTESGRAEVYVIAFDGGHGKWQVSGNGGTNPLWSRDGKHLYFLDPNFSLYSVPVRENSGALQFDTPEVLVKTWSAPNIFYDVFPDGSKFLFDRVSQQVSQSVSVITNFTAGLKK
jgi:eukaryotic-like serine/threonine-protein kinase